MGKLKKRMRICMYAIASKKQFEVSPRDVAAFKRNSALRKQKLKELNLDAIPFDKVIKSKMNISVGKKQK